MVKDILLGNFYNDLKIERLNPLCLKSWINDGNNIVDVFIENDAIDFLTDIRNGESDFTFIGTYEGPQRFISVSSSPARPTSLHDYIERLDKEDAKSLREEIKRALQSAY
ncbi:hypothetical protein [Lactiplantibacillus plantarum]|uniref:hypothetical protein n=1 Tax=Lactiplantibacillus plantarum TaxID=1590 RepID=UPI000CCF94C8|nr:hypothetical protein [Lactiplantibacillus plantarum]MDO8182065.1 hypothetical protein [Lactiplantibacillus plantarum]PNW62957.1 hypothetical protein ACZ99_10105 [Lactobacillus sp. ATCC 15578]RHX76677.1 hypothetical protein D2U09_03350 [Lactiplantibacillus plantarum]TXJ95566.1 hypothetical protein FU657_06925 [Lactiplantibacillus plantarum]